MTDSFEFWSEFDFLKCGFLYSQISGTVYMYVHECVCNQCLWVSLWFTCKLKFFHGTFQLTSLSVEALELIPTWFPYVLLFCYNYILLHFYFILDHGKCLAVMTSFVYQQLSYPERCGCQGVCRVAVPL